MCKKIGEAVLKSVDEDVRIKVQGKLRLLGDFVGWVPTFMQGLIGAITG